MLAFSIAPDACNGIEYYTFLRRAYTRRIPFLSNTKFNIRKYFPEKTKKNNLFFWLRIYGTSLTSLKLKNRFHANCTLSFWYRCPGANNLGRKEGKGRSTKDPTPLRKGNESFFRFFILF